MNRYENTAEKDRMIRDTSAQWQKSLSQEEFSSLQDYTREVPNYYKNINSKLRGRSFFWESGNRERVERMHDALQRSEVPCDCTVYRGASLDALGKFKNLSDEELIGKNLQDKGFMSTSTAKGAQFPGEIKLEIAVPKGAHGAYLGNGISVCGDSEKELLFDRGSRMKVTGVYYDEFGGRVVQVRML